MTITKPVRERPQYIHIVRPRCPSCGSVRLRAERSTKRASGTVVRYSRCRDCGGRVYIVVE